MSSWDGRSRGTVFGYQIFAFLIKYLGLGVSYIVLDVVVFYYLLFARGPKQIIYRFYHTYLKFDQSESKRLVRRNFTQLGRSIADKMAFLTQSHKFEYDFAGHHHLVKLAKERKGAILISAHIGNWDVAGNMLCSTDLDIPVNVVMYAGEVQKIKEFMDSFTGGQLFKVIEISEDLSHVIQIRMALDRGEFVCIHGDRYTPGSRTITANFLDNPMKVPAGPFAIAAKFGVPACFVWNIKERQNTYVLTANPPVIAKSAQELAQSYLNQLSAVVKKFPQHWFNYHDVFES